MRFSTAYRKGGTRRGCRTEWRGCGITTAIRRAPSLKCRPLRGNGLFGSGILTTEKAAVCPGESCGEPPLLFASASSEENVSQKKYQAPMEERRAWARDWLKRWTSASCSASTMTRASFERGLGFHFYVDDDLRVVLKTFDQGRDLAVHGNERSDFYGREETVASGTVFKKNDMAGLLAADDVAAAKHFFEDVAVADGSASESDTFARQDPFQAKIG